MFSLDVVQSDRFLDLSVGARLLYFYFGMNADDDGIVGNPKTTMRLSGCNDIDFDDLISEGFIIRFDSGAIAITHWHISNAIQNDRYKGTIYKEEFNQLTRNKNKVYTLCIQSDSIMDTQVRLGQDRVEEENSSENNLIEGKVGESENHPPDWNSKRNEAIRKLDKEMQNRSKTHE